MTTALIETRDVDPGPALDKLILDLRLFCDTLIVPINTQLNLPLQVDLFMDLFYNVRNTLMSLSTTNNAFSLAFLVSHLTQVYSDLSKKCDNSPLTDHEPCTIVLGSLRGDVISLANRLLDSKTVSKFLLSKSPLAHDCLLSLMKHSLRSRLRQVLSAVGHALDQIIARQRRRIDTGRKSEQELTIAKLFPVLVLFLKTCYNSGASQSAEMILTALHPLVPLESVGRQLPIALYDLIDYYRYMAFNLLAISINRANFSDANRDRILANQYFKVLLTFPNISHALYATDLGYSSAVNWKTKPTCISFIARAEISFLSTINSMLIINDLEQFIFPSPETKREMNYVITALSYDFESYSTQQSMLDVDNTGSIGSFLYHGTPDVKNQYAASVFKLWISENFTVPQFNSMFTELMVSSQNVEEGYLLQPYVRCLHEISRLLTSLAIDKITINNGINDLPSSAIDALLNGLGSRDELMQWKRDYALLSNIDGDSGSTSRGDQSQDYCSIETSDLTAKLCDLALAI